MSDERAKEYTCHSALLAYLRFEDRNRVKAEMDYPDDDWQWIYEHKREIEVLAGRLNQVMSSGINKIVSK